MDLIKSGMSLKCPCPFDDQNYGDWKIHMSMFIKSLGIEIWEFVVLGWIIPANTKDGKQ